MSPFGNPNSAPRAFSVPAPNPIPISDSLNRTTAMFVPAATTKAVAIIIIKDLLADLRVNQRLGSISPPQAPCTTRSAWTVSATTNHKYWSPSSISARTP